MLVLSRHKNESIMVGEIEITVIDIRGDKVRLGIEAPKEVPVHRLEVWEAIKRQNLDRDQ
jgi:carbon storage regulator